MLGYVVLIASFILIAVVLNGGFGTAVSRRIEYPELLGAIERDQVQAVAIRNTSLVGLLKNGSASATNFPDRDYDFETTIGDDFITARVPVDARTRQPYGLLHGGVSVVLAEVTLVVMSDDELNTNPDGSTVTSATLVV